MPRHSTGTRSPVVRAGASPRRILLRCGGPAYPVRSGPCRIPPRPAPRSARCTCSAPRAGRVTLPCSRRPSSRRRSASRTPSSRSLRARSPSPPSGRRVSRLADRRGRRLVIRLSFAASGRSRSPPRPRGPLHLCGVAARAAPSAARCVGGAWRSPRSPTTTRAREAHSWFGCRRARERRPARPRRALGDQPTAGASSSRCSARCVRAALGVAARARDRPLRDAPRERESKGSGRMRDLLPPRLAPPRRRARRGELLSRRRARHGRLLCFHPRGRATSGTGLVASAVLASPARRQARQPGGRDPVRALGPTTHPGRLRAADGLGGRRLLSVPGGLGAATPICLSLAFAGFVFSVQAFGVADRLVDTELFPTDSGPPTRECGRSARPPRRCSGTSDSPRRSARSAASGGRWRCSRPRSSRPALALFWWVTTETRGM